MIELPASALIVSDGSGRSFGQLRLVPVEGKSYAEGIFDVAPVDAAQGARPEVRWLCKRHYQRYSEHRLTLGKKGEITVRKGGFTWILDPVEEGEGYVSRAPSPRVLARWATDR